MIYQSELIKIHYELTMSIGMSLDLKVMLKNSLRTFLRKLNCLAGGVHFFCETDTEIYRLESIVTIPRDVSTIYEYDRALIQIPSPLSIKQLIAIKSTLPITGQVQSRFFYIIELPGLGIIILIRSQALDILLIESLEPILSKLAVACNACLQNEDIIRYKNKLQELVAEKTNKLIKNNQQLIKEIERRKNYETALVNSEKKYRDLVQSANSIILHWDKDGKVIFFNNYAQVFFGFSEAEILGKHVVGTIVPECETTGRNLRPLMEDICKNPHEYEFSVNENMRKDGSRVWIAWTNKVLTDEKNDFSGVLSVGADITEQKRAEQQLQEAKEAAEAANRAKSQFLANMSHEIRTPMNAIIGLSHLVLKTPLTLQQKDYLNKIDQSANSLLNLINDILDFSKIEAGKLDLEQTSFTLKNMLERIDSIIGFQANEKGLGYSLKIADTIPARLCGDGHRFEQVLLNLSSNAVKFTEKGKVSISIELDAETKDNVILRCLVQDTGIGMNQQQIEGLFKPFHQADASTTRKYGGTGLGLAISKRLIDMMGGELRVKSAPAIGSIFIFTAKFFKTDEPEPVSTTVLSLQRVRELLTSKRILVVEDNQVNMQVATELLQQVGAQVVPARNGQEAVEKVAVDRFDVILMDLQMPEMDGIAATLEIRKMPAGQGIPILAMTANAMEVDRRKCLDAGMNDHIPKPIRPQKLYQTLIDQFRSEVALDATVHKADFTELDYMDESNLFIPLNGVNTRLGMSNVNYNPALYRSILWRFIEDYGDFSRNIQKITKSSDFSVVGKLAHSIKGIAGTIGAENLQSLASHLENAIIDKKLDSVQIDAAKLSQEFELVIASLKSFLQDIKPDQFKAWEGNANFNQISTIELKDRLTEIAALIDQGSSFALEKLINLKQYMEPVKFAYNLQVIQGQLTDYEFEQARKTLDRIMDQLNLEFNA